MLGLLYYIKPRPMFDRIYPFLGKGRVLVNSCLFAAGLGYVVVKHGSVIMPMPNISPNFVA